MSWHPGLVVIRGEAKTGFNTMQWFLFFGRGLAFPDLGLSI